MKDIVEMVHSSHGETGNVGRRTKTIFKIKLNRNARNDKCNIRKTSLDKVERIQHRVEEDFNKFEIDNRKYLNGKKNSKKKNKDHLRSVGKQQIAQEGEEKDNGAAIVFDEIIVKNFVKLMKDPSHLANLKRINTKKTTLQLVTENQN